MSVSEQISKYEESIQHSAGFTVKIQKSISPSSTPKLILSDPD